MIAYRKYLKINVVITYSVGPISNQNQLFIGV